MKLVKPAKLELYSFIFSIPLIALVLNLVMYGNRLWVDYKIWVLSMPLIMAIGVGSWYMHISYTDWVERSYPELTQTRQRVFRKALVSLIVMPPSMIFIFLLYHQFHILGYQIQYMHIIKGLVLGLAVNMIFETLYEADYVFLKYKESKAEQESIQLLSINQEFDALKSQVSPHFLFNCFNTLSSLISMDKARAEIFLNEMSKVYRYLLRNNEESMSTVENEIQFIRSYFKLLQTRYGEAVKLNIQVDKRYERYLLPSLSLQLLVENVVKHNALSKDRPLVIDIFTVAANQLVVNNNLQRKPVKAPGNQVGLENIRAKYLLLGQPGFQVIEDDKNFTVVLPLIWSPAGQDIPIPPGSEFLVNS